MLIKLLVALSLSTCIAASEEGTCSWGHNNDGTCIGEAPDAMMSDAAARSANVGGEVLCQVF